MQPIVTTDVDYHAADAESGGELLRLRRERLVMIRRITELEAEISGRESERAELLERMRLLAQHEPEGDG